MRERAGIGADVNTLQLNQVRLADRGAELPAHGGVREGVRAVQHRRAVHAAGRAAGPAHGARPGPGRRLLPARGRHLHLHLRELHERALHGPGPAHPADARPAHAGE